MEQEEKVLDMWRNGEFMAVDNNDARHMLFFVALPNCRAFGLNKATAQRLVNELQELVNNLKD